MKLAVKKTAYGHRSSGLIAAGLGTDLLWNEYSFYLPALPVKLLYRTLDLFGILRYIIDLHELDLHISPSGQIKHDRNHDKIYL